MHTLLIRITLYLAASLLFAACRPSAPSSRPVNVPATALTELAAFQARPKFLPDTSGHTPGGYYTGLSNPALQAPLSQLLNLAADDFRAVAGQPAPTEGDFQTQIDRALARFEPLYIELDSEDRDRVCLYIEELMDTVGLASSGGRLSIWRYGFDPEALLRLRQQGQ